MAVHGRATEVGVEEGAVYRTGVLGDLVGPGEMSRIGYRFGRGRRRWYPGAGSGGRTRCGSDHEEDQSIGVDLQVDLVAIG